MKYLKKSILLSAEISFEEQEALEAEWELNSNLYRKEFDKIKSKLPKSVINVFDYSHDAHISEIQILNKKIGTDIAIHMESDMYPVKFKGKLMHMDVADFYFDSRESYKNFAFSSIHAYSYGEILREDKYWTHNFFLYAGDAEVFIKCKKLEWRDL